MNFVVDQLAFLGLNEREVRVFTALCTFGRSNMTTLASRSGLPRTTVDAIVRRMVRQGIIEQVQVKGHYEYEVILNEISGKLESLRRKLEPGEDAGQPVRRSNDEKAVNNDLERGPSLRSMFLDHHGERATICISEDPDNARRVLSLTTLIRLSREADLRCDILLTADLAHALLPVHSDMRDALSGYDVRLNLLPASFSVPNNDICVFRDVIILLGKGHTESKVIDDVDAVDAIDRLLFIARESGWGMDARTWLHIKHA